MVFAVFLKEAETNCVVFDKYSSVLEPTKSNIKKRIWREHKGKRKRGNRVPSYNRPIFKIMNTLMATVLIN